MKPWIGLNVAMTQDGRRQADGAVAILVDGKIYSLPQERLSRLKHDGGIALALPFVLQHFGLGLTDIGRFAVSTTGEPVPDQKAPVYLRSDGRLSLQDLGVDDRCIAWQRSHHESHAFETIFAAHNAGTLVLPALIFISDRVGQLGEHQSYYLFDGKQLTLLRRDPVSVGRLNGLGETYDRVTRHLGWRESFDSGKTMALAGLATPPIESTPRLFFDVCDGVIVSLLSRNEPDCSAVLSRICPIPPSHEQCVAGPGPTLAAQLQYELEQAVIAVLWPLIRAHRPGILLCGGGMATNCHLLGTLASRFSWLAVQGSLAPGDSGQGIGNLVAGYFHCFGSLPAADPLGGFWLKPRQASIIGQPAFQIPNSHRCIVPIMNDSADIAMAANRLAHGDILAVIDFAHEPGPRALGFHSLLADARDCEIPEVLNRLVKGRETFRPFGAILSSCAMARWFGHQLFSAPFMDLALTTSAAFRARYPAVVHADGSSRVQVLGQMHSGSFICQLMTILMEQYGIDVVLNTSLNAQAQPILFEAASLDPLSFALSW